MRFSEFKRYTKSPEFSSMGKLLIDLNEIEVYSSASNKLIKLCKDKRNKIIADEYFPNGTWYVHPIALDWYHVYIVCPYCGNIHSHGGGKKIPEYEGYRVPHCIKQENGNDYYIERR